MKSNEALVQSKKNVVLRLKRIEGQLRAIQKMIDEGESCENVAQQMSASRAALDKAFFAMIACAMDDYIGQGGSQTEMQQRLGGLSALIAKFG